MVNSPVFAGFFSVFKPDPQLTVSEWADEYRMLPQISAAEPGRWRTSRTPYLAAIMNDLSPTSPVEEIVFMKGAQIGASESGNNWVGFVIDKAPGPMLVVQPTVDIAKRYSQQRIAPMINECTSLKEKIGDPRSRDSANTQMSKEFPGGVLLLAGANSAAGLRSMPIRYLMLDETDAYPPDCDGEGSPIDLAVARTRTFSRRKIYKVSTPTIKGLSHIEAEFETTDQRRYFLPCPHCGHMDFLRWDRFVIDKKRPEKSYMACTACGCCIEEHHKTDMLLNGEWRPTAPQNATKKRRGYHLSSLYSPVGWYSWADAAKQWIAAQGNPEKLKAFINTVLGETWEEQGQRINDHALMERAEDYPADPLPVDVVLLTAGIDVQLDRIEMEIVGWGCGEESWSMDYVVIHGDPQKPLIWQELDAALLRIYPHPRGVQLQVARACIDTGGTEGVTQSVYEYAKTRFGHLPVIPIKGIGGEGRPVIGPPSRTNIAKIPLYPVGTYTAKDTIYGRLRIEETGAGYMHFPRRYPKKYFEMLTAEEVRTKYSKGHPHREWHLPQGRRNEALDCRVYALAALHSMNVSLEQLADMFEGKEIQPQKQTRTVRGEIEHS